MLNNNVVTSIDKLGQERVLMVRGRGFQLQPTDIVDPATVEKTFILEQGSGGYYLRSLRDQGVDLVITDEDREILTRKTPSTSFPSANT